MKSIYTSKANFINRIIFIILILFYGIANAYAGKLTLAWDPSVSANVGGYRIYYGQNSKNYTDNVDVGNVKEFQLANLTDGVKYYFAVKAYDKTNNTIESAFSNEISAQVLAVSDVSVDFSASTTTGYPGMIVAFTPKTSGSISSWLWDFGDGNTSTIQNPTHTYNIEGVYTVKLTVTGTGGSVDVSKVALNLITVKPQIVSAPVASFSVNTTSGTAPTTLYFSDTSTGVIANRLWDFGDGTTSTLQNPSHTYDNPGLYTVSLTVSGSGGSDTYSKSNMITITPQATNTNSLVAVYNFENNDGKTVLDLSGYGNNGTINGATVSPNGRYGKAMYFDGVSDIITVNNSASLAVKTGFTLEVWVKPSAIQRSSVLSKLQASGSDYSVFAYGDKDMWGAEYSDGSIDHIASGRYPLPIDKWTHLASTYDGKRLNLYRNGRLVISETEVGVVQASNGSLEIGGNSALGEFFKGYIDEVRIYNRALTAEEIRIDVNNLTKDIIGNKVIEPYVDSNPEGIAEAFKSKALINGTIKSLQVYLDASSLTTVLIAGLYTDNNGHPGKLLAQGKLINPKAGVINAVKIADTTVVASKSYWIAILGAKGQISFRNQLGHGATDLEIHAGNNLVSLPNQWITGKVFPLDGPISAYGVGN